MEYFSKHYIILFLCTFVIMAAMDFLWIGNLALEFYKSHIGVEMEFRILPAILFYLMYVVGVIVFVSGGEDATNWKYVAGYGALFGFFAYATYDFTNMATLKGWTWETVVVDIAWGIFNTAFSTTLGWLAATYIQRKFG